jgi:hypothetical protein
LSIIDRKYYKWNDSESDFEIKLGMDKYELLSANIIRQRIVCEELEYEGIDGCPWRIHFKNNKVEQIWFNSDCDVDIKGFDFSKRKMKVGVEFLNTHFKKIPELDNREITLKEYRKSDVLYVIYGDFFVRLIAIIRRNCA